MRALSSLITQSRKTTGNTDFGLDSGIQDQEFVQYANDAQDAIEAIIKRKFQKLHLKESVVSTVAGQEEYSIPADCYMGTRIEIVEVSQGGVTDYTVLKLVDNRERISNSQGLPQWYILRDNKILLQPKPSIAGNLRITYQRQLPRLDIRRATVSAVVLDSSTKTITSLTLDTSVDLDSETLLDIQYLSVVDAFGVIQMKYIPITDINVSSGVVTIAPGFVYETGETIASGNYVVAGHCATTHSQLPQLCETYLLEYMNLRINMRDSSSDQGPIAALLQKVEGIIDMSFAKSTGDVSRIPIIDTSYITSV